jgi:hypothetical protein
MQNVEVISSNNDSAFTAKTGEFSFVSPPGTYTLTTNLAGYNNQSQRVALEKVDVEDYVIKNIQFKLSPKSSCQNVAPIAVDLNQLKQSSVAEYDDKMGELMVKDVRIGGNQRIAAKLQVQANFRFKLVDVTFPKTKPHRSPAFYDADTLLSDIPNVFAFGKVFRIKMKNIAGNNYLFQLVGVPVELP